MFKRANLCNNAEEVSRDETAEKMQADDSIKGKMLAVNLHEI